MNKEARPLESVTLNYYFNSSNDDILDMLEGFQNPDGGFGRGIEPDFKLIESSPMATSIGLRYIARTEWMGILTLEALLALKKFNRLHE